MSYYATCPICGSNLDPGEVCECSKEKSPCATNTEAISAQESTTKQDQYTPSGDLAQEYFEYVRRIIGILRDREGPYTGEDVQRVRRLWYITIAIAMREYANNED